MTKELQPWELTDDEIEQEQACGEYEYEDSTPEEGQFGDEETLAGGRAIATAAQKRLAEWLKVHNCEDEEIIGDLIIDHVTWSEVKAALGGN